MDNNKEKLFSEFPPVTTQEWEAAIQADLKGADYEKKLIWNTLEGFKVKPYYRAEDIETLKYLNTNPGEAPYLRGNESTKNNWEIRQDIESEDLAAANQKAVDALKKGADAVGLNMKNVKNIGDLNVLLNNIDITKSKIYITSSVSYKQIVNLLIEYIKVNSIEKNNVNGALNFDPWSYALKHGNFYNSFEENISEAFDLINLCKNELPNFKIITVNGNLFHNSGSSIIQELAFTLASANEYVYQLTKKGLSIDDISPRIMFSFGIGSNFFMEIAKIRAARLLWSKIVEQYKPMSEKSMKIFIHCVSSLWNKTIFDSYVNMLRTTTEATSAAIAGADSITVLPFDLPFRNSDEFSERIARNQQIILKEETYLDKIVDPSAGSYYIENLTDSIAHYSWELFKKVEEKGGFIATITENFVQEEINKIAQIRFDEYATRKTTILGTNQYPNLSETMLDKVQEESTTDMNDDVDEKTSFKKLVVKRGAEQYEELRLATEIYAQEGNSVPKVFLLTYGNLAMRKARATFASNFFGCAGYEIIDNPGFSSIEDGIKSAFENNADIVVICSSDEEYIDTVPVIAKSIKEKNPEINVTLAGYPKEHIEAFKNAGVDDFIHIKSNVIETLTSFQKYFGIM
jgi:methylmalonyl-CoA mutase